MEFHIKNEHGDIIASFVNKCDRDYLLDALQTEERIAKDDVFWDSGLVEYDD